MPRTHQHHVCRQCGKVETKHWTRHWATKHPKKPITELADGELPLVPFSNNWASFFDGPLKTKYFMTLQLASVDQGTEEMKQPPTVSESPMIPTHPIEAAANVGPTQPSSNPLPPDHHPDHSDAVPKVLLQEAMKLSYTAKMKMAARLLDSVGTTLRSDCERLHLWIHTRPFEDSLPSVITPRDRQQRDSALRGRTLRLVPSLNIEQHKLRTRDQKYMAKVRSTKWAMERHQELERIQTLLP